MPSAEALWERGGSDEEPGEPTPRTAGAGTAGAGAAGEEGGEEVTSLSPSPSPSSSPPRPPPPAPPRTPVATKALASSELLRPWKERQARCRRLRAAEARRRERAWRWGSLLWWP